MKTAGPHRILRLRVAAATVALAVATTCVFPARGGAQTTLHTTPKPNPVELKAADGTPLAGFWLDARDDTGGPAVLLLHNDGRNHESWSTMLVPLRKIGCSVLALDLRGHGASRKLAPEQYDRLVNHDNGVYQAMVQDAEAGIDFLVRQRGIHPEHIIVVGGELGCGIGFAVMARNPKLRGMVALSPATNDYGFDTLQLVKKYGKRPLLIVTTKQRLYEGPQAIADALKGSATVRLEVYPGADVKGVGMLGQPAKIENLIVEWLQGVFPNRP